MRYALAVIALVLVGQAALACVKPKPVVRCRMQPTSYCEDAAYRDGG